MDNITGKTNSANGTETKAENAIAGVGNAPAERKIFLVRIDGNIGSGKTTLIARLRKRFPTSHVIPEPTEHWFRVRDDEGRNPLSAFYADKQKYAALFQLFAFVTRLEEVERAYREAPPNTTIWITERSVESDMHIFAQNLFESKQIDKIEMAMYRDMYDTWIPLFGLKTRPDATVYIRTAPETCHKRMQERGRSEEVGVKLDYLRAIHAKHEEWIGKKVGDAHVVLLDGELDADAVFEGAVRGIEKLVAKSSEKSSDTK